MNTSISTILLLSMAIIGLGTVYADSAYPLNWGDDNATEANETFDADQSDLDPATADVPALPVIGLMILGGSLAGIAVRKMRRL